MNDDELTDRLRRARPNTPRRGAPLEPRHEAILARIMSEPVHGTGSKTNRLGVRPAWFAAASVLFIVAIVAIGVTGVFRPLPAVAATPMALVPESVDGTSKENMIRIGESVLATGHEPGASIRFQSWALTFDPEAGTPPQSITPEEHEIRHRPDGGMEIEVRAGAPYDRNGKATVAPTPAPGTVLWSETIPADESIAIFTDPPLAAAEFPEYFARNGTVMSGTSGEYFSAVRLLLTERALSSKQESALIGFLASLPDITVDGMVADRLERQGVAFSTESRAPGEYRDTLVLSATEGILSYEVTYIGSDRTDIRAPAVIEYTAWE